ncbi:MAG: hypothetical protein ACRDM1_13120 [Gaiellaceae bacterium]
MTKADQVVENAAGKLESFVREAQASGGVKARIGDALAEDPDFLRKLKPSLIAARAKGEIPIEAPSNGGRSARPAPEALPPASKPAGPAEPKRTKRGGGPSPWLVIGAALAVGYALAKVIDWRGHAHPHV